MLCFSLSCLDVTNFFSLFLHPQGMAFSLEERQVLGLHGLIPPRFKTQEEQVDLCKKNVERYQEPLNKFIYLASLQVNTECFHFS